MEEREACSYGLLRANIIAPRRTLAPWGRAATVGRAGSERGLNLLNHCMFRWPRGRVLIVLRRLSNKKANTENEVRLILPPKS